MKTGKHFRIVLSLATLALMGLTSQIAQAINCNQLDAQVFADRVSAVETIDAQGVAQCEFSLAVYEHMPSFVCPLAVGAISGYRFKANTQCSNIESDIRRIVSLNLATGAMVIEGVTD